MFTIEGIYDGQKIWLLGEIPFKGRKKVLITFLNEAPDDTDLELEIKPIEALRGCARNSNLIEKLLKSKKEDIDI